MQVTFSAEDPLDRVIAAVEAVYGVRLKVKQRHPHPPQDQEGEEPPVDWDPAAGKVRQDAT